MYQLLRRAHWAFSEFKQNARETVLQCTMYQFFLSAVGQNAVSKGNAFKTAGPGKYGGWYIAAPAMYQCTMYQVEKMYRT